MDLTQLANLGEFIGGIAVLATLMYLALEVRRGRANAEAASVDALASGWNSINSVVINNRELMELFMRGSGDPESLDPVDQARFFALGQSYINHFQTIKRRYDAGVMPEEEWKAHASGFANVMDSAGGEWVCERVTATPDLLAALRDYRTDGQQYAILKGVGEA